MLTKKLGRIVRLHRVTSNRRDSVDGPGWEYGHVAIEDCSRFAYVEILPDAVMADLDPGHCFSIAEGMGSFALSRDPRYPCRGGVPPWAD